MFEELLLRKMRDANANFDDFPKKSIDDWSAYMYDQRAKLDKCDPLLRETTALLKKCETEKKDLRKNSEGLEKDLRKNSEGLENALMNETETTST